MLNQVVLNTAIPKTLNIDAADPEETLVVKSISGLSGADITLFTGDYARDGGYYQGRRASKFNPVFNFKLNPDYRLNVEVSDVREMLYSWFLEPARTSDGLQVILRDDRRPDRYFIGYTEKIETGMFSRDTSVQVSMISVDAYLRSMAETTASDTGWVSTIVNYAGSAPIGLEMTLKVNTATSQLVVVGSGITMKLNKAFAVNDIIVINTETGKRSIKVNGIDAMVTLDPTSRWIDLGNGANVVAVYGTALGDGKVVMTNYKYRAAWWGI